MYVDMDKIKNPSGAKVEIDDSGLDIKISLGVNPGWMPFEAYKEFITRLHGRLEEWENWIGWETYRRTGKFPAGFTPHINLQF